MFKVISCILVALCINFQQDVNAASFLNPLGSFGSLRPLGILDGVQNKITDSISDVHGKISDTRGKITDSISDTITGTKDKISDVHDKISDKRQKITDNILKTIPDIGEFINKGVMIPDAFLKNFVKNMMELSEMFESSLSADIERLKEKSRQFLEDAMNANTTACKKLYMRGRADLAKLRSRAETCVLDESRLVNEEIRELIEVVSALRKTLPNGVEDVIPCFQSVEMARSCMQKGMQSLYNAGLTAKQCIQAGVQLGTFYPKMKLCLQKTAAQFLLELKPVEVVKDAGMCVISSVRRFG